MTSDTREAAEAETFVIRPDEGPQEAVDLPIGVEQHIKIRGRYVPRSRPRPVSRTVPPSDSDVEVTKKIRTTITPDGCDTGVVLVLHPGDRVTRRLAEALGIESDDENAGRGPLRLLTGRKA